jgi:putative transposase
LPDGDARRLVEGYVEHYNNVRLNSAIGYITLKDMLAGHQQEIQADRDRKLEAARGNRGRIAASGPRDV